jgi:hypothetical protein
VDQPRDAIPDGEYKVLATLVAGERSYRIFADLLVESGDAVLELHRFDHISGDEWFVERKISLPLRDPEIVPLPTKLAGASFKLAEPVRLDEVKAAVVFGPAGPPEV